MSAEATPAAVAAPEETSAEAWWVRMALPLLAAAAAFTWFLEGQLQRMYGMTGDAELATYQQTVWEITQAHLLRANVLLQPILLPIAAVERLWPSPIVLAIVSSAGLAAAGPAAYLFLRAILQEERRESVWLAVALAAPIAFWAATQEAAHLLFDPMDLALTFALVAAWAALRGRRSWMWAFVVLDLACGKDQAYTVLVLALLMRSHGAPGIQRHWRYAVYLAIVWFLLSILVAHPTLTGLPSPDPVLTVAGIVASMLALPFLAPRWLLLAVPALVLDVLSQGYVLLLMFPLIIAGGMGARSLLRRTSLRPALAVVVVLAALIIGWGAGSLPPSLLASSSAYTQPDAVPQLQTAASVIPADAPVSADPGLAVWLANRSTIGDFPNVLDPNAYIVLDLNAALDAVDHEKRQAAAQGLSSSGRRLLYNDGRFQVWSPIGPTD